MTMPEQLQTHNLAVYPLLHHHDPISPSTTTAAHLMMMKNASTTFLDVLATAAVVMETKSSALRKPTLERRNSTGGEESKKRHRRPKNDDLADLRRSLKCPSCEKQFRRFDALQRHMRKAQDDYAGQCRSKRGRMAMDERAAYVSGKQEPGKPEQEQEERNMIRISMAQLVDDLPSSAAGSEAEDVRPMDTSSDTMYGDSTEENTATSSVVDADEPSPLME